MLPPVLPPIRVEAPKGKGADAADGKGRETHPSLIALPPSPIVSFIDLPLRTPTRASTPAPALLSPSRAPTPAPSAAPRQDTSSSPAPAAATLETPAPPPPPTPTSPTSPTSPQSPRKQAITAWLATVPSFWRASAVASPSTIPPSPGISIAPLPDEEHPSTPAVPPSPAVSIPVLTVPPKTKATSVKSEVLPAPTAPPSVAGSRGSAATTHAHGDAVTGTLVAPQVPVQPQTAAPTIATPLPRPTNGLAWLRSIAPFRHLSPTSPVFAPPAPPTAPAPPPSPSPVVAEQQTAEHQPAPEQERDQEREHSSSHAPVQLVPFLTDTAPPASAPAPTMSKPTPPSSSAGPSSTHDSLVEALLRTRTRTLPVRDSTDAASRGELLDHPLESDGARVTRALADQIEVVVRLAVGIGNAHLALEGIGPPEVRRKVVNVKEEEKGEDEDNGKEDGKEKEKEEGEDKEKPKQVKFQIDQDGADTAAAAITGPAGAAADDNADPDSSFADLEQRQEGIEAIMAKLVDLSSALKTYHAIGTPAIDFPKATPAAIASTSPLSPATPATLPLPRVVIAQLPKAPHPRAGASIDTAVTSTATSAAASAVASAAVSPTVAPRRARSPGAQSPAGRTTFPRAAVADEVSASPVKTQVRARPWEL